MSLWFKTTGTNEVLLSSLTDPVGNASTSSAYTPNLYIGSSGYLWGEFEYQNTPIASNAPVNDGQWHNVVLAAAADSQVLYVDGKSVGSVSGSVVGGSGDGENYDYVGAGFLGWEWPDQPHPSQGAVVGNRTYFTGNIAEVAFYPRQLTAADASAQWVAAQHSPGLTPVESIAVTDPGGRALTDRVRPAQQRAGPLAHRRARRHHQLRVRLSRVPEPGHRSRREHHRHRPRHPRQRRVHDRLPEPVRWKARDLVLQLSAGRHLGDRDAQPDQ